MIFSKKIHLIGLKDKFIKVFKKDINNLTSDKDYQKYLIDLIMN